MQTGVRIPQGFFFGLVANCLEPNVYADMSSNSEVFSSWPSVVPCVWNPRIMQT